MTPAGRANEYRIAVSTSERWALELGFTLAAFYTLASGCNMRPAGRP